MPWFLFITAGPRLRLFSCLDRAPLPLPPPGLGCSWSCKSKGRPLNCFLKQLMKLEDVKGVLSSQPLSLRIALLPWFSKGASVHQHECAHEARGARGHR